MERSREGARVGRNQKPILRKMTVTEYLSVFRLSLWALSTSLGFVDAEAALFLEKGTVPTSNRQEI